MKDHEFSVLWDRYRDKIFSFIQARVESREAAEDLLQETFLRVYTGLCCLIEWERMERYVYRVARNLVTDHYRARRPGVEYSDTLESPYPEAYMDDDPAMHLAFSLRDMVDQLPDQYREALVLAEYEELSMGELAERLGLSLPAAKSRVQRAREKLKGLLLECCHFELDRLGGIINYDERCPRCDLERRAGLR